MDTHEECSRGCCARGWSCFTSAAGRALRTREKDVHRAHSFGQRHRRHLAASDKVDDPPEAREVALRQMRKLTGSWLAVVERAEVVDRGVVVRCTRSAVALVD